MQTVGAMLVQRELTHGGRVPAGIPVVIVSH